MVNWKDIHEDFGRNNGYYQQEWEKKGLTYLEAQVWIQAEFLPCDDSLVEQWKRHHFTAQQAKSWTNINSNKLKIVEFASYLRWKGYQPNQNLNLEKLKEEFYAWLKENKPAQEYLDCFCPKEQRNTIKWLNTIKEKNLTGDLDLSDFINLEELSVGHNQLTSLKLDNCLKLKRLWCGENQLTQLDLINLHQLSEVYCRDNKLENIKFPQQIEQITRLDISSNNFPKQDLSLFSNLINLERLEIGNKKKEKIYNRFVGSLEPLKNLSKLKSLDIRNTDIDSGLEYLADTVRGRCWLANLKLQEQLDPYDRSFQAWKLAWLRKQLQESSNLLFPGQPYNLNQFQQEIVRLKRQELVPQIRETKAKLGQLITTVKTKANNLEKIVDLLLETQKQISENKQNNDQLAQVRLEGQLIAYQNVLESNLTKKELQTLLNKQTELRQLEENLNNLQVNEQPRQIDWNNLHSNFTPQLIQAWQNHNFTAEQVRDWINIHSPADQDQAIQEPEFYAWLRDIKKVDSDWVLNHGNHYALSQEYQQSQQQVQILQPTNLPGPSNK